MLDRQHPLALSSLFPLALSALSLLGISACGEESGPVPVEMPAPSVAPIGAGGRGPIVMTPDGQRVDPGTERAIGQALRDLRNAPAEPPPAEAVAAAQDASALHGRWDIRHLLMRTNGRGGEPSRPLAPTSWEFLPDGALRIRGANSVDARYTYTGSSLVVSGFGPSQTYQVDRLTAGELAITAVIEAGSLRIENSTIFDRAGGTPN